MAPAIAAIYARKSRGRGELNTKMGSVYRRRPDAGRVFLSGPLRRTDPMLTINAVGAPAGATALKAEAQLGDRSA